VIIDTHAHVVPGTMLGALRGQPRLFPSVRMHDGQAPRMEFGGGGPGRPIQPRLADLGQRRDWLKQARVDHQLVGGWTDVYGYELPGPEGADWARFYNEHMAKDAGALASLTALATVPLQDGALAARVLEEALDSGFKGAMIATQPKGTGDTAYGGGCDIERLLGRYTTEAPQRFTQHCHNRIASGPEHGPYRNRQDDLRNTIG